MLLIGKLCARAKLKDKYTEVAPAALGKTLTSENVEEPIVSPAITLQALLRESVQVSIA